MLKFLGHRGRTLVILILLGTLLGIILFLNKILFPFLLASFLAYVLSPVIDNLHQRKIRSHSISRGGAVLLVYFVILLVLIGGGSYVVPKVSAEMGYMIQEFPKAVTKISKEWGPVLDEKISDISSLFPEPTVVEPLPTIENIEQVDETEEIQKENGELHKILDGYTYEIRGLDSDRIEIVPHRKTGSENGNAENPKAPVDMQTQLSLLAEEGVARLKDNMVRFLGLGRQLIAEIVGSVFTLFLTFMVAAFILVDTERVLSFWRSLVPKQYHVRYSELLKSLDKGLNGVDIGFFLVSKKALNFKNTVVIRPSVVCGSEDNFTNLFAKLSLSPIIPLVNMNYKFQPIFVNDVNKRMTDKWKYKCLEHDIISGPVSGNFDSAFSLDVLEHISLENENKYIENISKSLDSKGVFITGTPSIYSQKFASKQSLEGHINCKNADQLRELMSNYFKNVFIFSMNDEVVHTGFFPMAHYYFSLACGPK